MSTLIAVAYPSEVIARDALATLEQLQKDKQIELDDLILARRDDGKINLEQSQNLTIEGATTGAMWGGLLGLVFLVPVVGMVVGGATGAIAGRASDIGIDDDFARELSGSLPEGAAALLVLIRTANTDRVRAEMQTFGGTIMHSNLTEEAEARLAAALQTGASVE